MADGRLVDALDTHAPSTTAAVVTPGSGELPVIPAAAKAIAVDVRALPETAEAHDAVLRALTASLAPHASRRVGRGHDAESRRSFVVGEDVPTALAESRWIGIGNMGMAVRVGRLVADDGAPLPDIVRADYRALDARAALRDVSWPSARTPLRTPRLEPSSLLRARSKTSSTRDSTSHSRSSRTARPPRVGL